MPRFFIERLSSWLVLTTALTLGVASPGQAQQLAPQPDPTPKASIEGEPHCEHNQGPGIAFQTSLAPTPEDGNQVLALARVVRGFAGIADEDLDTAHETQSVDAQHGGVGIRLTGRGCVLKATHDGDAARIHREIGWHDDLRSAHHTENEDLCLSRWQRYCTEIQNGATHDGNDDVAARRVGVRVERC